MHSVYNIKSCVSRHYIDELSNSINPHTIHTSYIFIVDFKVYIQQQR